MISLSQNSVFDLKPIKLEDVRKELDCLLIEGEHAVAAFKSVRDQLVFTNCRIISIDVQGLTGKKKMFSSLPYSRIQLYTVQTPGLVELVPDSELVLYFANDVTAKFEIKGGCNILEIGREISRFILNPD